jgi:hypothetical protein
MASSELKHRDKQIIYLPYILSCQTAGKPQPLLVDTALLTFELPTPELRTNVAGWVCCRCWTRTQRWPSWCDKRPSIAILRLANVFRSPSARRHPSYSMAFNSLPSKDCSDRAAASLRDLLERLECPRCHKGLCSNCLLVNDKVQPLRTLGGVSILPYVECPALWICSDCARWKSAAEETQTPQHAGLSTACNYVTVSNQHSGRIRFGQQCATQRCQGELRPDCWVMNAYGQLLGTLDGSKIAISGPWDTHRQYHELPASSSVTTATAPTSRVTGCLNLLKGLHTPRNATIVSCRQRPVCGSTWIRGRDMLTSEFTLFQHANDNKKDMAAQSWARRNADLDEAIEKISQVDAQQSPIGYDESPLLRPRPAILTPSRQSLPAYKLFPTPSPATVRKVRSLCTNGEKEHDFGSAYASRSVASSIYSLQI